MFSGILLGLNVHERTVVQVYERLIASFKGRPTSMKLLVNNRVSRHEGGREGKEGNNTIMQIYTI